MNILDDFEKEVECIYKNETYSVRDNGSVLRHPKTGKKPRPTEELNPYLMVPSRTIVISTYGSAIVSRGSTFFILVLEKYINFIMYPA